MLLIEFNAAIRISIQYMQQSIIQSTMSNWMRAAAAAASSIEREMKMTIDVQIVTSRWCVYLQLNQVTQKEAFPWIFCGEDGLVVRITAETCLLFSSIQIQRCGVIQDALRIRMWICNVACVCVWIKGHQWLMIPFSGLKPREWSGFDVRTWRNKKHSFSLADVR